MARKGSKARKTDNHAGRLIKVSIDDLRPGMYVVDVGRGWLRHPWPTRQKRIDNRKDIAILREYGIREVVVDRARSSRPALSVPDREPAPPSPAEPVSPVAAEPKPEAPAPTTGPAAPEWAPPPDDAVSVADELPRARVIYRDALKLTRDFLADARLGRRIEIQKAEDHVNDLAESVLRNRDAVMALLKLRRHDEYTFTHSLNVAVICLCVGRQVGMDLRQLRLLGLGAIFHDLGKARIPEAVLNKQGPLSELEYRLIQTHAGLGASLMMEQNNGLPHTVYDVIRHHHERADGSGYPDGLTEEQLTPEMTICGLADVYDALSSDRVYHRGMLPFESLRMLFLKRGQEFSAVWTERFVQGVGIYPMGTCIRLSEGSIGVVVGVNRDNMARPRVRLVLRPSGYPYARQKTLDLGRENHAGLQVEEVVSPRTYGIDPLQHLALAEF